MNRKSKLTNELRLYRICMNYVWKYDAKKQIDVITDGIDIAPLTRDQQPRSIK